MVVIAALVGAGGLGVPVVRALNTVQVGMGIEAGLAIVLVAIILDRLARPSDRAGEPPLMDAALRFEDVDVFYPRVADGSMRRLSRRLRPGTHRSRVQAAIAACDAGAERDDVARQHQVTVAVRGASLRGAAAASSSS